MPLLRDSEFAILSAMEMLWPRLRELRTEIGEEVQPFLSAIWEHYLNTNEWPSSWIFNSRFGGRAVVRRWSEKLRGLVHEVNHGDGRYALTLMGALLAGDGLPKQKLIVRYFEFARDRNRDAPEKRTIKHSEVEAAWGISGAETKKLLRLLSLGHWHSGSSSSPGDLWETRVPNEVEDFPREGSLSEQIEALAFKRFDQREVVFLEDKHRESAHDLSDALQDRLRESGGYLLPAAPIEPRISPSADALSKRYLVFISSTYDDLKEERSHVMQALLEMDCIPTGMELFPSTSEGQWKLIERAIDECDYYIVVVAGRYGSIDSASGKSFTEREFDYALRIKKPILGFYHKKPTMLPVDNFELTDSGKAQLKKFTEKIKAAPRMCKSWETAVELGSVVKSAIFHEIKNNPQRGWMPAGPLSSAAQTSSQTIAKPRISKKYPEGADTITIPVRVVIHDSLDKSRELSRVFGTTWDQVVAALAPDLQEWADALTLLCDLQDAATAALSQKVRDSFAKAQPDVEFLIDEKLFDRILSTMEANKWIRSCTSEGILFYQFTSKGRERLAHAKAIRK